MQLICDGFHVSPVMVDILHRTLGDRIVLATDNMPPAERRYHIEGGVDARRRRDDRRQRAADATKPCATICRTRRSPFAQAIVAATYAPAKLIGLDGEMGRIAPGMRADLSFWDEDYAIVGTMVGGRSVYNRAEVAA